MSKLEQIFVLVLMIGIICGLGVASTLLRAHASGLDKEIQKESDDDKNVSQENNNADKQSSEDKSNDDKQVTNDGHPNDNRGFVERTIVIPQQQKDECDDPDSEACKVSRQDNNDASDEEVAKQDKKDGNDLTIILKLKYGNLAPKWYSKVSIEVGKYFDKFYDLSKKPSKVTIKHLQIPEGKSFKVYVNNYRTDEGEQYNMHNSVCKCPETRTIKVP